MTCETCNNDDCECGVGIDSTTLQDLVNSPQSVTVDGQTVMERSASDAILLDNYARARRRACRTNGNSWGSIGVARAVPPGTQGNAGS